MIGKRGTRIGAARPLVQARWLAVFATLLAMQGLGCAIFGPKKPPPKWLTVTGTVSDANGKGIIAATVSGNMRGSTGVTDFSGSFELRVPYNWTGILTAQHIDYQFSPRQRAYAQTIAPIMCVFQGERRTTQPLTSPRTSAAPHAGESPSPPYPRRRS